MPKKFTTMEFVEKARKVHGDKYDYSEVEYINIDTKVKIICPKHGAFHMTPYYHINCECPCLLCKKEERRNPQMKTTEDFIKDAKLIHGDKYDYSKVVYEGNKTKVEIICPKPDHGSFWQTPNAHLSAKHPAGCPSCNKSKKLTLEDFIFKARQVHGNAYDYSQVNYINSSTNVDIICPKEGHGVFSQEANSHLQGRHCPICAKALTNTPESIAKMINTKRENGTFGTSQPEENLYILISERFSSVARQYDEDERYPFACDFYIPERDLFVEYNAFWTHGTHWYSPHSSKDRLAKENFETNHPEWCPMAWWTLDIKKRKTAKAHNLNYVVLWNWKDVEEWFALSCPDGHDGDGMYTWKNP